MKCNMHPEVEMVCAGGRSAHPSNWACPVCEKEKQTAGEQHTPIPSEHALILNRLSEMQRSPYYATAREELKVAESTILQLEARVNALKEQKDLLDYVNHDSWRCGWYGYCHCGLDALTTKLGMDKVPYER